MSLHCKLTLASALVVTLLLTTSSSRAKLKHRPGLEKQIPDSQGKLTRAGRS